MTPRRVLILLIAGVIVIAGALWLASQRHLEPASLAGDAVLAGLQKSLNDVTEIHLAKGDGVRTTLKKGATDWSVSERAYPADSGHVRKLLLDLAALKIVEEKTHSREFYPRLGVEDTDTPKSTGTLVEVITPTKTFALIVGNAAAGKTGFVRVAHTEPSLLAQPLISVDADPRRWIDRNVVDIGEQRLKQAAVEPAAGPAYSATRDAPQQTDYKVAPIPKGRELSSSSAANEVGSALAALQADDVRPAPAPTAGAAKSDHAVFRTFNGLELDAAGVVAGDHHYVTLLARSTAKESQAEADALNKRLQGWQIEIPSYKYQAMFRPLEDLLKKVEPAKSKTATTSAAKKNPQ
ncbi:MAG TPA: DUF4340 domain-containing protein [Steroidobacteraceae bacterium]|nr:DUF4340 domain-containing protein [Steroidobacteraceae bacterium]